MKQILSLFLLLTFAFGCAQKSLQSEAMPQANVQTDGGASVSAVGTEQKATTEAIPEKATATTSKKGKVRRRSTSTVKETSVPLAAPIQQAPGQQEEAAVVEPQEASADMGNVFSEYGLYLLAAAGMGALFLILAGRRRQQS